MKMINLNSTSTKVDTPNILSLGWNTATSEIPKWDTQYSDPTDPEGTNYGSQFWYSPAGQVSHKGSDSKKNLCENSYENMDMNGWILVNDDHNNVRDTNNLDIKVMFHTRL